jgi:hypothetical protein
MDEREYIACGSRQIYRIQTYIASGYIGYENTGPQETWDRNYVSYLCENLDAMIQSDAWDKSQ